MRPLYVRKLTTEEITSLEQGLRSPSAFTVRRSQILLKSHAGQKAQTIAAALHCSDQTVREAIRAFGEEGLACLVEKSHARHDQAPLIDAAGQQRLSELVRLSPRQFGYGRSLWTRTLLAQQLQQEGHTERVMSDSSISNALQRAGIQWQRAKQWLRSPDPNYAGRKKDGTS